jgi:TorA maturation chaperone TorD
MSATFLSQRTSCKKDYTHQKQSLGLQQDADRERILRKEVTARDFRELAMARSATYGFLASMYLRAPSDELATNLQKGLASLKQGAVRNEEPGDMKAGLELLERYTADSLGKSVKVLAEELGVEWTRLFRGVKRGYGPPPPYESVYGGAERTMGPAAVDISKLYADAGAALSKELHELPDYIGVELDSMRFMCTKEAEAWEQGRTNESRNMLRLERALIQDHLLAWVPRFCDAALEETKNDFYRALLKMTKGVVMSEASSIDDLIATTSSAETA